MVLKIVLKTLLGLGLCFFGIFVGYLFLDDLKNGGNFLLLGVAIVLIGVGVFFLIKASNSKMTEEKKEPTIATKKEQNLLEKNQSLIKDWKKTVDEQARLKMLKEAQDKEVL